MGLPHCLKNKVLKIRISLCLGNYVVESVRPSKILEKNSRGNREIVVDISKIRNHANQVSQ